MKFTLTMDVDSAAFWENDMSEPEVEVARILHKVAERLSRKSFGPGQEWELWDHNGGTVGKAEVTE